MSVLSHPSSPVAESPAVRRDSPALVAAAPQGLGEVPLWRSGLILILSAVIGLTYWLNPPLKVLAQAGVILELPNRVDAFHGLKADFSEVELADLPKDTGLARKDYDDFQGHQIRCSIVLSGYEQRSIHRPEGCLVAQGWRIVDQENLPVDLNSGHKLVVRSLLMERNASDTDMSKGLIRAYYIYWFVGENVTTPSHFTRIFLSSWDRFAHNRAHRWAYVSVITPITENLRMGGLNAEQTQTLLTDFIRESVPYYQKSEMPMAAGQ